MVGRSTFSAFACVGALLSSSFYGVRCDASGNEGRVRMLKIVEDLLFVVGVFNCVPSRALTSEHTQ